MWVEGHLGLGSCGCSGILGGQPGHLADPVAADYRAALSISYIPMLVEAAIGGIAIGLLVSLALLRFPERVPGRHPVGKAFALSFAVLLAVTALIEAPGKFLSATDRPMHTCSSRRSSTR